jgi:hypothetical protein
MYLEWGEQDFGGKARNNKKKTLGGPRHRWVDNIQVVR